MLALKEDMPIRLHPRQFSVATACTYALHRYPDTGCTTRLAVAECPLAHRDGFRAPAECPVSWVPPYLRSFEARLACHYYNANDQFHTSILDEAQFWLFDDERNDPNSEIFYANTPLGYAPSGKDNLGNIFDSATPGTPVPPGAAQRTWRMWYVANGGAWNYSGNATVGSAPVRDIGGGFSSGLDYQVSPNILLGAAASYGRFAFSVPDRATSGDVDGSHVAVYTAVRNNDAYATAMLDFDYFESHESRFAGIPGTVLQPLFGTPIPSIPGFNEQDVGEFGSYSVSGLFETGYRYRLGGGFE